MFICPALRLCACAEQYYTQNRPIHTVTQRAPRDRGQTQYQAKMCEQTFDRLLMRSTLSKFD